jgi:hypothetical protein
LLHNNRMIALEGCLGCAQTIFADARVLAPQLFCFACVSIPLFSCAKWLTAYPTFRDPKKPMTRRSCSPPFLVLEPF